MGAATRASLLIEQASTDARFSMILDRDYRDTATVEVLSKRLNNRVFIWGCHEIENLLLEPAVLLEVLRSNGIETMTSASDVDHLLRDCARNLQELFVHQWAAFDLSAHRYSDVEPSIARPRDSVTFAKWVESERKHRIQAFSEETVAKAIENSTQSVQRCLGHDRLANPTPRERNSVGVSGRYVTLASRRSLYRADPSRDRNIGSASKRDIQIVSLH